MTCFFKKKMIIYSRLKKTVMKPLTCLTRVSNRKDDSAVNNSIDGPACDRMQGL